MNPFQRLRNHARNRWRLALLPIIFAVLVAGCDSNDPVDEPEPADVAGTYAFAEFSFDPDATALSNVNVLDTLVTTDTRLKLFEDGQFSLEYRIEDGPLSLVSGAFGVDARKVSIRAAERYEDEMSNLLLNRSFSLNRDALSTELRGDINKSVNLEAYSPSRYSGFTSAPGTLRLRLVLQQ